MSGGEGHAAPRHVRRSSRNGTNASSGGGRRTSSGSWTNSAWSRQRTEPASPAVSAESDANSPHIHRKLSRSGGSRSITNAASDAVAQTPPRSHAAVAAPVPPCDATPGQNPRVPRILVVGSQESVRNKSGKICPKGPTRSPWPRAQAARRSVPPRRRRSIPRRRGGTSRARRNVSWRESPNGRQPRSGAESCSPP